MRCQRRNLQADMRPEGMPDTLHLNRELAGEHEKKLARAPMEVPDFRSAGRHQLMNDTQPLAVDQPPAITVAAPDVVRRILPANGARQDDILQLFCLSPVWP